MTFTTRSRSFTLFGSKAISPRHVLMGIALMLTLLLIGCKNSGLSEPTDDLSEKVCKGVTNDNWGLPRQTCLNAYLILPVTRGIRACTLGKLPLFCADHDEHFVVYTPGGRQIIFTDEMTEPVRQNVHYIDSEQKVVCRYRNLNDTGQDLWLDTRTGNVIETFHMQREEERVGFLGFRAPFNPNTISVLNGSDMITIRMESDEYRVTIRIHDKAEDHCMGRIVANESGTVVMVYKGQCTHKITQTYGHLGYVPQ